MADVRTTDVRVGFDVGGTFTDVVIAEASGATTIHKTLTTPADPSIGAQRGIEAGLASLALGVVDVEVGVHGTTLVANAIIEARGAACAVIVTAGFEDLLEIGGGTRYDIYDLFLPFKAPLVERRRRYGVSERIDHSGRIVTPLDEEQVVELLDHLAAERIDALAVCFLHSYANPVHELRVAELARERHPELAVSLSCVVANEIGEYERLSTTVANAFVAPLVDRYVGRLQSWLFPARLLLMASNGGTLSTAVARSRPIALIESGPAAGVLAAAELSRRVERPRVLSLDMGGTTAKACVVDDAQPPLRSDFEAARAGRFKADSGIPLRVAVIDLIEIGAGGGSLARIDDLGLLKVGPHSAGADPGPACYGLGGEFPTVTDANLVLGYLGAQSFLGGAMQLDADAALRAIDGYLAAPLGLDPVHAAWGVHDLVNENMTSAIRTHVAEHNRDIRGYSLIAFGGAGPVHAVAVARKVGIREVIVPPGAGAMSAFGLLGAAPAVNLVRSQPRGLDQVDWADVASMLTQLEADGRAELATADVAGDDVSFEYSADMRYSGQTHVISVNLPAGPLAAPTMRDEFDRTYSALYTLLNPDFPIEVLNWRLTARGPRRSLGNGRTQPVGERLPASRRPMWVAAEQAFREVPVLSHEALDAGVKIEGPAVVEQPETTTVIGSADLARVDADGNLLIVLGGVS